MSTSPSTIRPVGTVEAVEVVGAVGAASVEAGSLARDLTAVTDVSLPPHELSAVAAATRTAAQPRNRRSFISKSPFRQASSKLLPRQRTTA
jgi:hypothetical protein